MDQQEALLEFYLATNSFPVMFNVDDLILSIFCLCRFCCETVCMHCHRVYLDIAEATIIFLCPMLGSSSLLSQSMRMVQVFLLVGNCGNVTETRMHTGVQLALVA